MQKKLFLIVVMLLIYFSVFLSLTTDCKVMNFYNVMKKSLAALFLVLLFAVPGRAQQPQNLTPEQKEKQMYEYIDKEVERLKGLVKLDEAQEFYVTMTLEECLRGMQDELASMAASGVQNTDLYQLIQDKWLDKIDAAYQSYFTPEQWKKYLKNGAEKAQKARAKRREKAESVTEN